MPIQLNFHETHRFTYPSPALGGATAMTVCETDAGDPFLAFIAQQPSTDRLLLCDLCEGTIQIEYETPINRSQIGGMGFSPIDGLLYCGNGLDTREHVTAINPNDGTVVRDFELSDPGLRDGTAFATNGAFMMRGHGEALELLTMNGVKLGERTYPGRLMRGVSASPNTWTALDGINNEIVVIGPFGNEIAVASAPGAAATLTSAAGVTQGPHAIAFDYVNFPFRGPQMCIPAAGLSEDDLNDNGNTLGTPFHEDTPWDPVPWLFRHRIFIANQTSNRVYAGYLTEA